MRNNSWFGGALQSALFLLFLGLVLASASPLTAQFNDSVDVVGDKPTNGGDYGAGKSDGTASDSAGGTGDGEGGIAPDAPGTDGVSLKDVSGAIQDAFCTTATALGLTGSFLILEGQGMMYLSRNAPPACGTLACAVNPVHCGECKNHWQRVSDMVAGRALNTLGTVLAAAGGAGLIVCDD